MEIKTDDKVKKGVNVNRATAAYFTKIAAFLEFFVAAIFLVVILAGAILLAVNLTGDLIHNPQLVDLNQVLGDALALVVGIEFIKMLVKHAPEAVVEVLLFAIAREMVVTHAGSAETLMGVIAVGIIFLIRHYLCPPKPARGEGGQAE